MPNHLTGSSGHNMQQWLARMITFNSKGTRPARQIKCGSINGHSFCKLVCQKTRKDPHKAGRAVNLSMRSLYFLVMYNLGLRAMTRMLMPDSVATPIIDPGYLKPEIDAPCIFDQIRASLYGSSGQLLNCASNLDSRASQPMTRLHVTILAMSNGFP